MESLTAEERRLLEPYFTNLDDNVFALINLPEVVKGALFSRYSRSRKGLRRLFIDEFLKRPELGIKELLEQRVEGGLRLEQAVKRAEEFYERVLIGFGDDSVAELGGAHLAVEGVSNVATKFIEATRIGISPLEKSTRYVLFDEKVDGQYLYYREPRIMASKHADLYIEVMDHLFETYSRLIEPMMKFVEERVPREEGVSDRAYRSAVRAKACDVLRHLLPAGTLTNLGLYGNGRAFEYLLIKMYAHPLQEIRELASKMERELAKVIPAFIRRASAEYGRKYQEYLRQVNRSLRDWARRLPIRVDETPAGVRLVDYDPDAEVKVLAATLFPYTEGTLEGLRAWVASLSAPEREQLLEAYLAPRANRRHKPGRALENIYYTFEIVGNLGIFRDLQRHRILTQEHQPFTPHLGYDIPPEIVEAGYEADYRECMRRAREAYEAIAREYPLEAQYVVPFAYRVRWYFTLNLRELYHLVELRTTPQGHPAYRRIAQAMYAEVQRVHPTLTRYMKFVDLKEYPLGRLDAEKRQDEKLREINRKP